MSVIERINNELVKLAIPRQLIPPDPVNYIPWTALTVFLSSLASERCVWRKSNDKSSLHRYDTDCGYNCSDEFGMAMEQGWIDTCPFKGCGKKIEVKEDENGR